MGKHRSLTIIAWFIVGTICFHFSATAAESEPDVWKALQTVERGIPSSLDRTGNIYLLGNEVVIQASPAIPVRAVQWRILDDRAEVVKQGVLTKEQRSLASVNAGELGVGWYRLEFLDDGDQCVRWTTAAVLEKLAAPIPQDSPICIDGANAWFAQENPKKQKQLSTLAALAGVNWIRDRIRWRDIQPEPNEFAEHTTYDDSANIQKELGLKVLQVFHGTPGWAIDDPSKRGRFPEDLRDLYQFCKAMSERFKGSVQAWEPWNEANAGNFGGHTVDEMCSLQKAAYLGFKAGDPSVVVGWNAYAGVPTKLHTKGVLANRAWPYFDSYNIHTYDWTESYVGLRKTVLEAASGRPIWVTEADRGAKYETDEPWCDQSRENEQRKAEFIIQSYATSLFAGCQRHFHFILGHYFERNNKIQFGLLRTDMTPRPAYCAFAALGRLLAGARCLGRLPFEDQTNTHVYAFRAKPDGVERDVLVAWAEKRVDWPERGKTVVEGSLPSDIPAQGVYDYFGRRMDDALPNALRSEPVFIMLPLGAADRLNLEKPPTSPYREGSATPIVMQLVMPATSTIEVKETPWAVEHEHLAKAGEISDLPIFIYNFGDSAAKGTVSVESLPEGWTLTPNQWEASLEPMERKALTARLSKPKREISKTSDCWIKLRGAFGDAGEPVLAFRLIAEPGEGYEN